MKKLIQKIKCLLLIHEGEIPRDKSVEAPYQTYTCKHCGGLQISKNYD